MAGGSLTRSFTAPKRLMRKEEDKRIAKIARKVTRQEQETKTVILTGNTTLNGTTPFSSSNKLDWFQIAAGTSQQTRLGNEIKVTGVDYRLMFLLNEQLVTSASEYPILVRVIEYTPKDDASSDLSMANFYELPDLDQYAVHSDTVKCLAPNGHQCAIFKRTKWFKRPITVRYHNTNADSVVKNERKLYFIIGTDSNHTLDTGACVGMVYQARVRFKDG